MKLIVGLGNPEQKYFKTFHNLGFMVVDKAVESLGLQFSKTKCKAMISDTLISGEKVIFAKPLTYMNLSGESVKELLNFYKIDLKDLIVVYDDVDLVKGNLRIRESGSAGTHNGMKNIVKEVGSEKFARIRVGFKPEGDDTLIPLINLVLSGIKPQDKTLFDDAITRASKACIDFANGKKLDYIMQNYNGRGHN